MEQRTRFVRLTLFIKIGVSRLPQTKVLLLCDAVLLRREASLGILWLTYAMADDGLWVAGLTGALVAYVAGA